MKIQNDGSLGSAPLEAPRTQPAPNDGTTGTLGSTTSGLGGDSVEISGLSARVSNANALDTQQRASRVAQLEALHSRGGYQLGAADLSGALVSQALNGAASGNP